MHYPTITNIFGELLCGRRASIRALSLIYYSANITNTLVSLMYATADITNILGDDNAVARGLAQADAPQTQILRARLLCQRSRSRARSGERLCTGISIY